MSDATPLILLKALWSGSSGQDPMLCLLFEGSQGGKGQLVLTIENPMELKLAKGRECGWI